MRMAGGLEAREAGALPLRDEGPEAGTGPRGGRSAGRVVRRSIVLQR